MVKSIVTTSLPKKQPLIDFLMWWDKKACENDLFVILAMVSAVAFIAGNLAAVVAFIDWDSQLLMSAKIAILFLYVCLLCIIFVWIAYRYTNKRDLLREFGRD